MIKYAGNSYSDGPIRIDFMNAAKFNLGKYCSIAANCRVILGGNHRIDWISTFAFPEFFGKGHAEGQPSSKGDVTIGNDVWIGDSVTIMSGVIIGDGSVIGAGSVVAKEIVPYSISAGNPCQFKRWRFDSHTRAQLLILKWWDWPIDYIMEIYPILQSNDFKALFNYAFERGLPE